MSDIIARIETAAKPAARLYRDYPALGAVPRSDILSEDAPEDTTNWLPVGDGFHLFMRIYTPDMDALETWTAPTITEIYPSNVN